MSTKFFTNENNVLRNRDLLIKIETVNKIQSAKTAEKEISKCKNCTLEKHVVLEFLKNNPKAIQKEIAAYMQKSERTAKTITAHLQTKGLLERKTANKTAFMKLSDGKNLAVLDIEMRPGVQIACNQAIHFIKILRKNGRN